MKRKKHEIKKKRSKSKGFVVDAYSGCRITLLFCALSAWIIPVFLWLGHEFVIRSHPSYTDATYAFYEIIFLLFGVAFVFAIMRLLVRKPREN